MKRFAFALLAASAVACGSDATGPKVDLTVPTSITPVGQSNINLLGGQVTTVLVKVLNANSTPLSGALVNFTVTGGGTVGSQSARTTAEGIATTQWTVASVPGQQTLTAAIPNTLLTATFAAAVTIPLTGTWTGTVGTQVLTLVLLENSGAVSGTGTLTGTPTGTRALTASGTLLSQSLTVTLTSGTVQPLSLKATVNGATMAGTLTGSGFTGEGITLTKQP